MAIEVDGDVHYFKKKINTDARKNNKLAEEGIKLIRLKNEDLAEDYESVIVYLEDIFKARADKLNISFKEFS